SSSDGRTRRRPFERAIFTHPSPTLTILTTSPRQRTTLPIVISAVVIAALPAGALFSRPARPAPPHRHLRVQAAAGGTATPGRWHGAPGGRRGRPHFRPRPPAAPCRP